MLQTMWLAALVLGAARGDDMTEQNRALVRALYEECINQTKLDRLNDLFSPEYTSSDGKKGPAAYRAIVEELKRGFPDIEFTVEELIAEGDRVVVRWRWTGRQTGTFRAFAPSNRAVTNTGIAIYRFDRGKIVDVQLESDRLGVLQQIGLVPADLGAGRAAADRR